VEIRVANQKEESVKLNPKVWSVEAEEDTILQVLNVYQNNQRQGTRNTKTRGDVSGGGRKPWKQKGTGRARQGSTRSPLWYKGGVTFGPRKNVNWKRTVNEKMKSKVICSLLSQMLKAEVVNVLEIKTNKDVKKIRKENLEHFDSKGNNVFLTENKTEVMAFRNVPYITVVKTSGVNVYDLISADKLVISKDSVEILNSKIK